jgi:hypothetical protein
MILGTMNLVTVQKKLQLEAREKTVRSVEEGRQFFMLEVERLRRYFG